MARYAAEVPGFGKQFSSVGPYMPQKDMANPLDELMSKAPAGKSHECRMGRLFHRPHM